MNENMTSEQHKAFEAGFYTGVNAQEVPEVGYNFGTASRLCPYRPGHPHRVYWMKGWLNAGL
ncbi:hypothetical protein [Staphylococcus aureus]|uniref:hypothetical protein n=1 Tax=Staphylococcus aureus TaxID=1280 RepID=UPI0012A18ADB|nr:hypothetical protein [Staphylococcus aureus]AYD82560.1 hypothetical protein ART_00091 [Achromobacter phage vB_Ade_ART]MBD4204907.1 hypothetical protein [Xanthomonas citri pv. citri]